MSTATWAHRDTVVSKLTLRGKNWIPSSRRNA